jgi:GT2 family glycosyltransferase
MASSMTDISVVICTFSRARMPDLVASIHAVSEQSVRPCQLVLVVDHNPQLLDEIVENLMPVYGEWLDVLENDGLAGVSGARNAGAHKARGELIVFLDDDAVPAQDWLRRLVEPFDDPSVAIAGSYAAATWPGQRPRWFPEEFEWVVGCSYRGLPEEQSDVRNVIGASMATRRSVFDVVGSFSDFLGRIGELPMGCEETEFCIRTAHMMPDARIVYVPQSVVHHSVSESRSRGSYFAARCLAEGKSKAQISKLVGVSLATSSERSYVIGTLSRGIRRGFADAFKGDATGLMRSGAIVGGLFLAVASYVYGLATSTVRASRRGVRT